MRMRLTESGDNRCVLEHDADDWSDPLGPDRVVREFWAPSDGGYIREITEDRPGTLGYQVCDCLDGLGNTLEWRPGYGSLARVIRREWRARARAMKAQARRDRGW